MNGVTSQWIHHQPALVHPVKVIDVLKTIRRFRENISCTHAHNSCYSSCLRMTLALPSWYIMQKFKFLSKDKKTNNDKNDELKHNASADAPEKKLVSRNAVICSSGKVSPKWLVSVAHPGYQCSRINITTIVNERKCPLEQWTRNWKEHLCCNHH